MKIALVLGGIALCFVMIDLITQYARYTPFDFPQWGRIDDLFHLGGEANIPTWFSTVILLAAAALLALVAHLNRLAGQRFTGRWQLLSLVFLYLSLDEAATLHENVADYLGQKLPGSLLMQYGWVLPGLLVTGLLALFYLPFLASLPARTRNLFVMAAVVYVSGAALFEVAALPYENGRPPDMGFAGLVASEEFLEMAGVSLFIAALVAYLNNTVKQWQFTLE